MDSPHSASSYHVNSCKDNEHHNFPWTWSDGPDNLCEPASANSKNPEFAIWSSRKCLPVLSSPHAAFHNRSNCWECGVLLSSLWKASHGAHLHFKERTFSKSANTFNNNNHIWCLFLVWWHLTILKMDWCNILYPNCGHNVTFNFAGCSIFAVCSLHL